MQTRGQKAIAALLFATAVIGAAAIMTQANAGPPGSYYWKKLPQNLTKGAPTSGGVDIEIVPDGRSRIIGNETDPADQTRVSQIGVSTSGTNCQTSIWRRGRADTALPAASRQLNMRMFAGILIACACGSALFASWLPLQFSVVTVFLFAGPHKLV